MCGISGVINRSSNRVEKSLIESLTDIIKHRGPDGFGYYFGTNFAFGHRRLSIIDLSINGHQPMNYLDKYWITYNGEIYNYIELRNELIGFGYNFQTDSDTEVILAAYDYWKVDCLQHFNGMWSFAIYDSSSNNIFMSRDRFGVKPFYYTSNSQSFCFGSEIKQILLTIDEIYVNKNVLIESLLTHIDNHTNNTYFENVNSLLPGHYILYDLHLSEYVIKKYYDLELSTSVNSDLLENSVDRFKKIFINAIQLRLRSDVRVGTCLSGGLDSSCISKIAADENSKTNTYNFIGIHAESSEVETNESAYATKVSEQANIELHILKPSVEEFTSNIEEVVYTQEEPFFSPSIFMSYLVFAKAKQLGCKVMLNGQGGDEVLLGYERYFASYLYSLKWGSFFRELFNQSKNSRLNIFEPVLYFFYFTNLSIRKTILIRRSYLKKKFKNSFDFAYLRCSIKYFKNIFELQKNEICTLQLPHLLRYEDRNSMRHSIETRLPFLDYRVVEFGVSTNVEHKIHKGWTKFILRKSFESILSPDIIWRKNKLGFNSPEKTWLNFYEKEMIDEITNSKILHEICDLEKLLKNYNRLNLRDKWLYYNVAVWERVYKVKIRN